MINHIANQSTAGLDRHLSGDRGILRRLRSSNWAASAGYSGDSSESRRPVAADRGLNTQRFWCSRSRRVTVLILGIILLSAADLVVTLAYARGGGMMEANPIVLYLVRATQSPWALGAYKVLTVGICVALLFRLRKHAVSEAAAWCAVAILAAMSVMWHHYSATMDEPDELTLVKCEAQSDHWLVFD